MLPQLIDIGCECIIGITQMSSLGVFAFALPKPAFSIFAVDLFITSIKADGFDHLVGKWPFAMYRDITLKAPPLEDDDGGDDGTNVGGVGTSYTEGQPEWYWSEHSQRWYYYDPIRNEFLPYEE